jgi:hypothetical protein
MATRELVRADLLDRLEGCWTGQQIGATLGGPIDGRLTPAALRFYDPAPGQASASQEMDFQLAWLNLLRVKGGDIASDDLAEQWDKHIAYQYDELGWADWNLRRGLLPPLSGSFNNWFKHSSGGMGRALLWSMVAPGAPQLASELAWQDAILDHSAEGLWAAMLWAAAGSAAFVLRDATELLEIGLAMVPSTCRTAGAVRAARDRFRIGQSPLQIREAVLNASGSDNLTDAAQNSGFIAMGLLHGKGDFGPTVTSTVNAGYNARLNGGMAGGIAGILRGRIGIPEEWTKPIGDVVIYGWGLRNLEVDRKTGDLAATTLDAAVAVLAAREAEVSIVDESSEGASPTPEPTGEAPVTPAPHTDESTTIGDRARFLEIDPAPTAVTPSAAPPSDSVAEQETEAASESPAPEAAMASPEERAEISDTAAVAQPIPTDVQREAAPTETPAETPGEAPSEPLETGESAEAQPDPLAETFTPAPDAAASAEESAPVSTAPDPLADLFAPSATPIPAFTAPSPAVEMRANDRVKELLVRSPSTAIDNVGDFEFTIDYGDNGPVLLPGVATSFTVAVRNNAESDFVGGITLKTPEGWQVAVPGAQAERQMIAAGRMARFGFVVRAPDDAHLTGVNKAQVVLTPANETPTTCELTFLGGSCWWITGPFANRDEEGYDKVFEVEDKPGRENEYLGRGGSMVGWKRISFRENVMELDEFFGGFGGVAYAETTLHFATQTDARLVIHSNDGVHVWLNNQRIFRQHAHEPFRPTVSQSRFMMDVTFKPGANLVRLKIVRCKEPLQFAFIVTDRQGVPLEDMGNSRW